MILLPAHSQIPNVFLDLVDEKGNQTIVLTPSHVTHYTKMKKEVKNTTLEGRGVHSGDWVGFRRVSFGCCISDQLFFGYMLRRVTFGHLGQVG